MHIRIAYVYVYVYFCECICTRVFVDMGCVYVCTFDVCMYSSIKRIPKQVIGFHRF